MRILDDRLCPDDDTVLGGGANDKVLGDFGFFNAAGVPTLLGGLGVDALSGGEGDDELYGEGGADRLEGGASDDPLVGDTLTGGKGDDRYLFNTGRVLGKSTVVEQPGAIGGRDTLDFSQTISQRVSVDLSLSTQAVNGNLTLVISGGEVIENATGGELGDTLLGNTLANTLAGGPGDDRYQFRGLAQGLDTVVELAGGGTDTADFSLAPAGGVTFDLSLTSAQTPFAGQSVKLSAGDVIENALGSAGNDFLWGNALANHLDGAGGADCCTAQTATTNSPAAQAPTRSTAARAATAWWKRATQTSR